MHLLAVDAPNKAFGRPVETVNKEVAGKHGAVNFAHFAALLLFFSGMQTAFHQGILAEGGLEDVDLRGHAFAHHPKGMQEGPGAAEAYFGFETAVFLAKTLAGADKTWAVGKGVNQKAVGGVPNFALAFLFS